jgi:hypothetical protein
MLSLRLLYQTNQIAELIQIHEHNTPGGAVWHCHHYERSYITQRFRGIRLSFSQLETCSNRPDLSACLDLGTKNATPVFFVTGKVTTQPQFLTGATSL